MTHNDKQSRTHHRSGAAMLVALTLVTVASLAVPLERAHAAEFYNCGHRIVTDYNQGWVRIAEMDGAAGRSDLRIVGWTGSPTSSQREVVDTTVAAAIYSGLLWAYEGAVIYIEPAERYPDCVVYVR